MEFMLSTFDGLIRVGFDHGRFHVINARHFDRTISYGLLRSAGGISVAQRISFASNECPRNWIAEFNKDLKTIGRPIELHPEDDLHEIAAFNGGILYTSGRPPFLYFYRRGDRYPVQLENYLPTSFDGRCPGPDHRYHLNSIYAGNSAVFVLAHNWTFPSFLLKLRILQDGAFLRVCCAERIDGVGGQCHSICVTEDAIWTLSGTDSALSRIVGNHCEHIPLPNWNEPLFPRGILCVGDVLLVGAGIAKGVRTERHGSATVIAIYSMVDLRFVDIQTIGNFGNTCAMIPL